MTATTDPLTCLVYSFAIHFHFVFRSILGNFVRNSIAVHCAITGPSHPVLDFEQVVVHITDVNDNAPVFSRPNYRASVSEAASPGTTVARVSATDADEGRNGELLYAIAAGNEAGAFAIDEASGQLSLASPLDRETAGAYTLMVIARDTGAELQHTATATVLVQVLDENDNAPEFAPRALRADVPETTPIGYELHRFSATDRDLGLNGEVSFSIVSGNVKEAFKVDSTTGALFLDRPLDYEQQSVYQLNVTASDGGSPRQAVSVGFTVRVLDVNDNPPQFANVAIVRQIEEGLPLHTPVVTVTAVDRDAGANGKLTYAITSQEPPGAHFSVRQDSGVVFTAAEIDREFSDTFRLTLTATDQGSPSLSSHKTVTIIVEDVNDNTPTFVSVDAGILPEDSEKGYVIMKLEAVDADANANGQVTYELVDGDKSLFAVDRSTGELSLLRAVSRPAVSYSLAVQASDQAVPSQRKSSRVHLTVLGANKRSQPLPAFSAPHYSATVPENQPAGTSVLSVRAQGTPQGRVQYFLTSVRAAASGALAGRRFTVHRDSGLVTTAAALDREAGSDVFQLELLAVDASAKVPRTAKASLIRDDGGIPRRPLSNGGRAIPSRAGRRHQCRTLVGWAACNALAGPLAGSGRSKGAAAAARITCKESCALLTPPNWPGGHYTRALLCASLFCPRVQEEHLPRYPPYYAKGRPTSGQRLPFNPITSTTLTRISNGIHLGGFTG
ncbi:hypothetical protein MRX96_037721 [Rhipicephalus microplus]